MLLFCLMLKFIFRYLWLVIRFVVFSPSPLTICIYDGAVWCRVVSRCCERAHSGQHDGNAFEPFHSFHSFIIVYLYFEIMSRILFAYTTHGPMLDCLYLSFCVIAFWTIIMRIRILQCCVYLLAIWYRYLCEALAARQFGSSLSDSMTDLFGTLRSRLTVNSVQIRK